MIRWLDLGRHQIPEDDDDDGDDDDGDNAGSRFCKHHVSSGESEHAAEDLCVSEMEAVFIV